MRKILATLILSLVSGGDAHSAPVLYTCKLVHIIDGDTAKVHCPDWPTPFMNMSVRVAGIDTPESKKNMAKCVKELRMGLGAKAWAKREFDGLDTITFSWAGTTDKYGGRIDAHVLLPDGKQWADEAIRVGFARLYNGKKKSDWCK